ncbi:MAG: TatD family hydrolase [Blautia wexlerae]
MRLIRELIRRWTRWWPSARSGLDYYWHRRKRQRIEIQKKMFRAQLDIAREKRSFLFMIHSRDAAEGYS